MGSEPVDRAWQGFALETLVFHELRVFNEVQARHRSLAYYHTAAHAEIDFVIETRKRRTNARPAVVCVEVKSAERSDRSWDRAMRRLAAAGRVQVEGLYGVYRGTRRLRFDGNVRVLPVADFLAALHAGDVF